MKISKLLPILVAFTLCSSAVYAAGGADAVNNSTAIYSLTLPEYLKITTTKEPGGSDVSYGTDYTSASIDTTLSGQFTVISNKVSKVIYLQGTSATSGGNVNSLYADGEDPTKMKLVFTNENHLPQETAVSNITTGQASVASNADAVAFAITASTSHDLFPSGGISAAWETSKQQAAYTIKNGTALFNYDISGNNETNTFSTHDTNGTYKATLTLTDASL